MYKQSQTFCIYMYGVGDDDEVTGGQDQDQDEGEPWSENVS